MSRRFDVSVGTDAAASIVDVDIFVSGEGRTIRWATAGGGDMYCFPMSLREAKVLRDMLDEGIEHVEAGGHGAAGKDPGD